MMLRKRRRVKRRKDSLSDTFSNVKRLLSNGNEYYDGSENNRVMVKYDNDNQVYSKSKNLFNKDRRATDTIISGEPYERQLKRRSHSKKQNNNTGSRKRRKVSQSKASDSQEDSGSSSGSSSDLRNTSNHRHVLSRLVQYTFYSVVNTGVAMDQGMSASALCKSFLALYLKLDESSVYSNVLDAWDKAGQKIIVLKGYNHKHLQYLAKEVRHIAVESNTLYKTTGQARVMLVLTAFGREEDMEEAFDDLCYLH